MAINPGKFQVIIINRLSKSNKHKILKINKQDKQ